MSPESPWSDNVLRWSQLSSVAAVLAVEKWSGNEQGGSPSQPSLAVTNRPFQQRPLGLTVVITGALGRGASGLGTGALQKLLRVGRRTLGWWTKRSVESRFWQGLGAGPRLRSWPPLCRVSSWIASPVEASQFGGGGPGWTTEAVQFGGGGAAWTTEAS